MATDTATPALKKGDRVVATQTLRGVPEGTAGKVRMVDGLGAWTRCWVQWDNGLWMGSIAVTKLVREKDWPSFQRQREEAAKEASKPKPEMKAASAEAAPAAGDGDAAPAAASKVPAHLLERAKKARERKAAAAAE